MSTDLTSSGSGPDILGRLEGVRRNGTGWVARCPAHDDHDGRLIVREGDEGQTQIYCTLKCSTDAVTAALDLAPGDLHPFPLLDRLPPIEPEAIPDKTGWTAMGSWAVVQSFAAIEAKPIRWLWPGWLAREEFHIAGGYMGDGKSTLTAWLAAVGSVGGVFPDGSRSPVFNTLLLIAEDNPSTTVKPRLEVHGADCARVHTIPLVRDERGNDRALNLRDHVEVLRAVVHAHGIDLIVIDPLSSFMTKSDRNSEGDVRDILTPLRSLQEETGVAILGVMHIGKPTGSARKPLQMLLGSTGFPAIARVVWMVADLPDEHQTPRAGEDGAIKDKVVQVMKSNIAVKPPPLRWHRPLDGAITWGGAAPVGVEEALQNTKPEQPIETATDFLRDRLNGGGKPQRAIEQAARDQGISMATLRRAKDTLGVTAQKETGVLNGPWLWRLPPGSPTTEGAHIAAHEGEHLRQGLNGVSTFDSSPPNEDAHPETVSTFPDLWEGAHQPINEHLQGYLNGSHEDAHFPLYRHVEHLPLERTGTGDEVDDDTADEWEAIL